MDDSGGFQTQFTSVMENVLKTAVGEATRLFERTLHQLRGELVHLRQENADLKTGAFARQFNARHAGDGEKRTDQAPGPPKCDVGVQCVVKRLSETKAPSDEAFQVHLHMVRAQVYLSKAHFHLIKAKFYPSKAPSLLANAQFYLSNAVFYLSKPQFHQSKAQLYPAKARYYLSKPQFHWSKAQFFPSKARCYLSKPQFHLSKAQFFPSKARYYLAKSQFQLSKGQFYPSTFQFHQPIILFRQLK
ncbi:hypothetical protein NFI96_002901 [Prochilodus magdalenae]|nr:hypothetical protein NFI96_002901 [Prochilodus magdalenae]